MDNNEEPKLVDEQGNPVPPEKLLKNYPKPPDDQNAFAEMKGKGKSNGVSSHGVAYGGFRDFFRMAFEQILPNTVNEIKRQALQKPNKRQSFISQAKSGNRDLGVNIVFEMHTVYDDMDLYRFLDKQDPVPIAPLTRLKDALTERFDNFLQEIEEGRRQADEMVHQQDVFVSHVAVRVPLRNYSTKHIVFMSGAFIPQHPLAARFNESLMELFFKNDMEARTKLIAENN